MHRVIRSAVIGVCALAVAGVAFIAYRASLEPATMTGVAAAPGAVALEVRSQTSAAGVLRVAVVRVPVRSWVVVTALETPDHPAFIAGMASVPAGTSRDVTVALGPGVGMNAQVSVGLNVDRGVAGRFEFDESRYDESPDKPYFVAGKPVSVAVVKDTKVLSLAEAAGAQVSSEVTAAPGAAVLEVADRLTVIDRLVVDRVVAPRPSWVVAYVVDDTGKPAEAVGRALVPEGISAGVAVPIRPDADLTDKLLVALQADEGTPGSFDFSASRFGESPDKPYAVSGAEVSAPVLRRGFGMDFDNTAGTKSGM